jgi:ATP-dependent DNA helicase RecQ
MIARLRRLLNGPEPALRVEGGPVILPGPWPAGIALSRHSLDGDEGRTDVGDLLGRFKYAGERRLARPLAEALALVLRRTGGFDGIDLILHVPATTRRLRVPPTCDLGRHLAKELRVGFLPGIIDCTCVLAHQKDIVHSEGKRANVEGAFRVRRTEFIGNRKLLLVDDVFDSGATLEEIWRVLMQAGAQEVVVATITKTRWGDR